MSRDNTSSQTQVYALSVNIQLKAANTEKVFTFFFLNNNFLPHGLYFVTECVGSVLFRIFDRHIKSAKKNAAVLYYNTNINLQEIFY